MGAIGSCSQTFGHIVYVGKMSYIRYNIGVPNKPATLVDVYSVSKRTLHSCDL